MFLIDCSTPAGSSTGLFAPPVRPALYWYDEGERVSLSKAEASALFY
jgi:hypothetical protein